MFKEDKYNPDVLEKKWQQYWEENDCFVLEKSSTKPKYYVLEMFPYPSGRIHMGHLRNYSIGDVIARFKRAQGYNVLHPMGWDAFGLPAENAAINRGIHPKTWTYENVAAMRESLKRIGLSYDWNLEINTCDASYYKHEQEMFITLLENNLAYQKEALVNWDPVDNTVLANEQVIDGKGWRSGAIVEQRNLKQWFFKITDFAEELLNELSSLSKWPEKVRLMQEKWIGKSEGALVNFFINSNDKIEVYTTRPETLFGGSFIALAYNHPIVEKLAKTKELENFLTACKQIGTSEQSLEKAEKLGYDTGLLVKHPVKKGVLLPVYIANFVILGYGTGAVFGCPAHDSRDHAFAIKYNLPITEVIKPFKEEMLVNVINEPFIKDGIMVNSDFLDGLTNIEAKEKIITYLEDKSLGKKKLQYRLRDWGISRQRYWGCPIPVIYCPTCGTLPVLKTDLPVLLPEDVTFDKPGNPLSHHPTWKYIKCHKCGGNAERETDTFDTFMESSWYFGRFCNPNSTQAIDKKLSEYWLPVDLYIGGIEHAVLHLLYSRFFSKALAKCNYWQVTEPFNSLLTQGMVCHNSYKDHSGQWIYPKEVIKKDDKYYHITTNEELILIGTEKMSKSKNNVVEPSYIIEQYGADAARMFVLSDSPPERDIEWTDEGVESTLKYLNRLYKLTIEIKNESIDNSNVSTEENENIKLCKAMHKAIFNVTESLEKSHINKAIANIRELNNVICESKASISMRREALETLILLLNPIAPHITEELWSLLGNQSTITQHNWLIADPKWLENDYITIVVQVSGRVRGTVEVSSSANQEEIEQKAKAIPAVINAMKNKSMLKLVYVPKKIINFVCN